MTESPEVMGGRVKTLHPRVHGGILFRRDLESDREDAERIGVGYAKRGVMRGTVAIPVRLDDGTLIGYIGIEDAVLPPRWQL